MLVLIEELEEQRLVIEKWLGVQICCCCLKSENTSCSTWNHWFRIHCLEKSWPRQWSDNIVVGLALANAFKAAPSTVW